MRDLISRQAATTIPVMPKEHRHYQTNNLDDAYEQGWTDLQECIENLPPVQPKHGNWIEIKNKKGVVIAIKCDRCSQFPKHCVRSDFCPSCGADMRGSEDGTD